MVALPVISGIHRVALKWRVGASGPTAVNVLHFHGASSDPVGLFTALDANVSNIMWTNIGTNTGIYEVDITPLDGHTATAVFVPAGLDWAGASAPGDYLVDSAIVLSLRSTERGRRHRGRVYLPFPLESAVSDGTLALAPVAMQGAWDAFRAAMTAASWPWHVASYGYSLHKTNNPGGGYTMTPFTFGAGSDLIVSSTVEIALGTQRRRQTRVRAP